MARTPGTPYCCYSRLTSPLSFQCAPFTPVSSLIADHDSDSLWPSGKENFMLAPGPGCCRGNALSRLILQADGTLRPWGRYEAAASGLSRYHRHLFCSLAIRSLASGHSHCPPGSALLPDFPNLSVLAMVRAENLFTSLLSLP